MTLELVSQEIPPHYVFVIHRLADEGVPIAAIARSLTIPSDDIRRVIHEAVDQGSLIESPRDDWPPGSSRANRGYSTTSILHDIPRLHSACCEVFRTTNLQSALLVALLRRHECTKDQLHDVIEENRAENQKESTDKKMVDVVLCNIRKKLGKHDIDITTLWGRGYKIDRVNRAKAVVKLDAVIYEPPPEVEQEEAA